MFSLESAVKFLLEEVKKQKSVVECYRDENGKLERQLVAERVHSIQKDTDN